MACLLLFPVDFFIRFSQVTADPDFPLKGGLWAKTQGTRMYLDLGDWAGRGKADTLIPQDSVPAYGSENLNLSPQALCRI